MIIAGIVSYNPCIDRLKRNLEAIEGQVDRIIVVDNNSNNIDDIEQLCNEKSIHLKRNEENKGLATALNQIFERAETADWVLTLDQDSVCPMDYIEKAKRYMLYDKIGIISSPYYESNLGETISKQENTTLYEYRNRCITSGAIVCVKAYRETSGYDEFLSVDYVDFDFSIKLRQAGYLILRMNDVLIQHELGHSSKKRFLFWNIRYTEHSAEREYLIARNIVIFIKRHHTYEKIRRDILSLGKHFIFTLLYDKERMRKLRFLYKGVKDGIRFYSKSS